MKGWNFSLKKKEVVDKVPVEEKVVDVSVVEEVVSVDAPLDSVADVDIPSFPVPVGDGETLSNSVNVSESVSKAGESKPESGEPKTVLAPFEEKRDPMEVFGKAFGGQKATLDGNIADMSDGSKNLSMKTRLRDVQAISVWEFVGKSASKEVLSDGSTLAPIGEMYADLAQLIKSNSCSEDGWRSEQLERIYTARRETEDLMPPMNKTDALLGKNRR